MVLPLTGQSFTSTVLDPSRHVFVLVYSVQCDRCDDVRHHWRDVSRRFGPYRNILITALDGSLNEVPRELQLATQNYPTFLYFPIGTTTTITSFLVHDPLATSMEQLLHFVEQYGTPVTGDGSPCLLGQGESCWRSCAWDLEVAVSQ